MSGVTIERMLKTRAEKAEARVIELEADVARLANALRRTKARAAAHNNELGRLRAVNEAQGTGGWCKSCSPVALFPVDTAHRTTEGT